MASVRGWLEHRWASRNMSAYVDGELSAAERRRLELHADVCPECGPMRRTLLRLMHELRDLRAGPAQSIAQRVIQRWIECEHSHENWLGDDLDAR